MVAHPRSVWVVDDSPLDGSRAAAALRELYEVELFADGSAALEQLASKGPPDVLVLDWIMPGISGVEVCRYLRASGGESAQSVAILLLTSHQRTEQVVEGLSAGANDYLSKPYAEAELLARVGALVRSRELLVRTETAERTLRLLLDGAPDAILVLDETGRISYANAEAEQVVGLSASALVGTDAAGVVPGLQGWSSEQEARSNIVLPDVSIRDQVFSPIVRVLRGAKGSGTATLSLRNVTAHRQREAKRLDFYAIVAHDLRSPLNVVLLRADALLRGARGALEERAASEIRNIRKNADSMVELINDFLEFARLESPSYSIKREPLDMVELLRGVVDNVQPLVDAASHRLETITPEAAVVVGDRARLAQVLMNLLTNAVKYTPSGGRVSATIRIVDASVDVRVEDDGPGIDPALLPTLTNRYVRGEQAGQKHMGTGLGLMIVRQILEAHGSVLAVDSTPGAGSRFSFRLASG